MEEKVVRKTTVKRAARKTPVKVASVRAASVRKASGGPTAVRKAPTRIEAMPTMSSQKSHSLKILSIGLGLFTVLIGISAMIGLSDKGQLDVAGAIANRKQSATAEEKMILDTVPTQQVKSLPNGGLVGMGQSEPQIQPSVPEVASTTDTVASSSDTIASSTSEMIESSTTTPEETSAVESASALSEA